MKVAELTPTFVPSRHKRASRGRGNGRKRRALREKILKRDNNECLRCGAKENLTIDRIKPGAQGGKYEFENCQTLCEFCNNRKGDKCISYRTEDWT